MNHVWWYIQSASETDLAGNGKIVGDDSCSLPQYPETSCLYQFVLVSPDMSMSHYVPSPLSVQPTVTAQTPHLYSAPDRPGLLSTIFVVVKLEMSAIARATRARQG
jgi:hypothetical protein